MYHPTTRVLDVLQSRGSVTAAELAGRMEVDVRTVRRYVAMLQEIGIPVEGRSGRHGGYRLRPGYRLPPLMLGNDEALAVTLGLLFARRFGLTGAAPATEGALAKIERVLPEALRLQVRALADALVLDRPAAPPDAPRPPIPPAAILIALATGAADRRRTTLTYRDASGATTTRGFDPYAVVYLNNVAWYTVGHCHLRRDVRVFRLDRVVEVMPEGTPFTQPAGFDGLAYVQRAFAQVPARWSAEFVVDASREEAQRWAAPLFALVEEEAEEGGVVVCCTATDLDWLARTLVSLPFGFRVRRPSELIDALARVRDAIDRAIGTEPGQTTRAPIK